ncbi:GntR family transcriptional regulator [Sphingobacterium spiritivorum]|uniref:GntR family transcriptional regulator n=1 Tax=Sphingobacterium spiritivorum TaxID=258 RepID=UPI003DA4332E
MRSNHLHAVLQLDKTSAAPKYLQLANAIMKAIRVGDLSKNDLLPSINELSAILDLSRDTIEKGYRYLKKNGIILSVPGKGYFIAHTDLDKKGYIALFFNKLSAHKKIVYDSFVKTMGEDYGIDLFVYNNDVNYFKSLLKNLNKDYQHIVVIPHFIKGKDQEIDIIREIPKDKLIVLGKELPELQGEYACVYENFEKDIYNALKQANKSLAKYKTLKLIFPDNSYFPKGIIKGFYKFCQEFKFEHLLVSNIQKEQISAGEVYINLIEEDLVRLLDKVLSLDLEIGKDVGVISYNETPLKKFILSGITTISTDFKEMGKLAAKVILNKSTAKIEVPFYLKMRNSL